MKTYEILKSKFSNEALESFAEKLSKSGEESIDSFLENQTGEFLDIGKGTIAAVLLAFEMESALYYDFMWKRLKNTFVEGGKKSESENNWYQLLWSALNAPFENFQDNALRIITFNYDRSLEHYLFTCLKNKYPAKSDAECASKMCQIVHVHGSLGPLPWQQLPDNISSHVPYDSMRKKPNDEVLLAGPGFGEHQWFDIAKNSIMVIHESATDTPQLQQAREWIRNCGRLYFLGFGYHPSNLERLEIRLLSPRTKHIRGTIYALSCERRQHISNMIQRLGVIPPGDALINTDIYSFLHDHVSLTMG